ncbi:hypothetical protein EVAR_73478_1 [Eumeta japonica]|uniref:Uncharacterized protein n=1 Tax=Eumeta variegata TaxID=151549 RepID=A0A4C1STG2_EUMVA|nr:hypothetical protein EVAR_73478_1 [Eumeta japonica]
MANSLASRATELNNISLVCAKPFGIVKSKRKTWAHSAGDTNEKKARELLKLNKPELSRMMGVVTRHFQLLLNLNRIDVAERMNVEHVARIVKHWNTICAIFPRSHKYYPDILGVIRYRP